MKLPVLSYTLLREFKNCPRKAYRRFVAKDLPKEAVTPGSPMQVGIADHEVLEKAIKAKRLDLLSPPRARMVAPLIAAGARAEEMLGIAKHGGPVTFFAPLVWLRGKLDVVVVDADRRKAMLLDWKTGKPREDPDELRIQAVLLKAAVPTLDVIKGAYVWLKEGKVGLKYDLSDTEPMLRDVRATAEELEQSAWEPTPNPLCGWCPVKDCEFNRSNER